VKPAFAVVTIVLNGVVGNVEHVLVNLDGDALLNEDVKGAYVFILEGKVSAVHGFDLWSLLRRGWSGMEVSARGGVRDEAAAATEAAAAREGSHCRAQPPRAGLGNSLAQPEHQSGAPQY
jgi:hypothetical protein